MAEEKVGLGSVKRFGSRYGRKPKIKFSQIETEQRKHHKCPYCSKMAVKRLALGIWQCKKCNSKFAGKAYSVERTFTSKESDKGVREIEIFQKREENLDMESPEAEAQEEQAVEAEEEAR
jgi:large subunit ribosomal protein L37Ae